MSDPALTGLAIAIAVPVIVIAALYCFLAWREIVRAAMDARNHPPRRHPDLDPTKLAHGGTVTKGRK